MKCPECRKELYRVRVGLFCSTCNKHFQLAEIVAEPESPIMCQHDWKLTEEQNLYCAKCDTHADPASVVTPAPPTPPWRVYAKNFGQYIMPGEELAAHWWMWFEDMQFFGRNLADPLNPRLLFIVPDRLIVVEHEHNDPQAIEIINKAKGKALGRTNKAKGKF